MSFENSGAKPFIICVDDEKAVLDTLTSQIEESHLSEKFEIEAAQSGDEALDLIIAYSEQGESIAVVVSDQIMPLLPGDKLLAKVHQILPDTQNILLTGQSRMESVISAINSAKLFRYLTKPWDREDLLLTIEAAGEIFLNKVENDRKNRLINKLYEVSALFNTYNRVEPLMEPIMYLLIHFSKATAGAFLILGDDSLLKVRGFEAGEWTKDVSTNEYEVEIEPIMSGRCFPYTLFEVMSETLEPYYNNYVLLNNLTEPLKFDPYLVEKKPKSLLAVPLVQKNQLIGVIYLENSSRYKAFTSETVAFLELLAPTVSTALNNVLLYESIEEKSKKISQQNILIAEKAKQIEEKITEITDSIYATERIQKAIMLPPQMLNIYFSEADVFFQPRDIVSGDFYWATLIKDYILLAVADCTGHGIPGAMLSVLGINFLDRIISADNVYQPDKVLSLLDDYFKEKLQQVTHDEQTMDGMDISLIAYELPNQCLHIASANRPVLIQYKDGSQELIKGDRFPIGGSEVYGNKAFNLTSVYVKEGDSIFMFSDGITDQFGGISQNRKFTLNKLQSVIEEGSKAGKDIPHIIASVRAEFLAWQGKTEQLDDILILGFKV